ncbi:MAG: TatD family hydrolase [Muribaculaceae bacterium]|nr:TatD family hydrolase [Muribaculaceae bacterium]
MIPCLDIHTHHPAPQPDAVISVSVNDFSPREGQRYSLGIHPWETEKDISTQQWELLEKAAMLPEVVAIGEAGIDKIRGGFMFRQILVLNKQIEISEKLKKPLILHDVKAHEAIVGLKRNLNPKQKWLVHGFRAKPTVAKMLTDEGIYLSFGEKFNPESLKITPKELILAETDESPLSIQEIISGLSQVLDTDITSLIAQNTCQFLGIDQ